MDYNRYNLNLILRTIQSFGDNFKSVDEIYNALDPKIDRQHFDILFREIKGRYLEFNHGTNKYRLNTIGKDQLFHIDLRLQEQQLQRLKEQELQASLHPEKKPLIQTIKTIAWRYIYPFGKSTMKTITHIVIEVIIAILAAYLIFRWHIPH